MDIKQLKAAVQLAKLRVGSDPSDANKAKLEHAQNEYDNAHNPETKTEHEPNPNKQPVTPNPTTNAAPETPKPDPLENHPLKTTRTAVAIAPMTAQELAVFDREAPEPTEQPETPEAK